MNPKWAEENLQTIRTLMERSAVYRRALAPILLFAGILGLLASSVAMYFRINEPRQFATFWLGVACVAVAGAFLLARRQALSDKEPFWSPPTRRVAHALLPPLLCGLFVGILMTMLGNWIMDFAIALVWLLFYGCALHSAGFFMVRSIRWFAWLFILGAIGLVLMRQTTSSSLQPWAGNVVMGFFFGFLHLIYGVYLYLTEKGRH